MRQFTKITRKIASSIVALVFLSAKLLSKRNLLKFNNQKRITKEQIKKRVLKEKKSLAEEKKKLGAKLYG